MKIPPKSTNTNLTLTYIGHSKHSKGVEELIYIIESLKKRREISFKLNLCLSGFGNNSLIINKINKLQLNDVINVKNNIDVVTEIASSDLIVLPLRTCVGTSLTPNLIVESLTIGTPIAIPRLPELSDVISYEKNSIEIFTGDIYKSVQAIESAYKDRLLIHMAKQQKTHSKSQLSLENFFYSYKKIINT